MRYIYQYEEWPRFSWDLSRLMNLLSKVHLHQGHLFGRMETLGFHFQNEALLRTMTLDVVKNSEIENEVLNVDQVRSSIARRLGMDIGGLVPADRHIEGIVEMMMDATQHFNTPLTQDRLFDWHASLFPTGRTGMRWIRVGAWRDDSTGPMQVVSGLSRREKIHFEAPPANSIEKEMNVFLTWFNKEYSIDPILKAAIAHLWFVTIHPFEDGNGRIARTIADMQLARADGCAQRFYSMSAQIRLERSIYYKKLEQTQKNGLDITDWLEWFLECIDRAICGTETTLTDILKKARFWETYHTVSFNERQRLMLNKLLDDFFGKLTTSKWAKITKCSQDTALRDIQELIRLGILIKDPPAGRSTSYSLPNK